MSKFMDDFNAALTKVASTQNDAVAIQELKDLLAANKATDDEQSAAIVKLTETLGAAPPVTPPEE